MHDIWHLLLCNAWYMILTSLSCMIYDIYFYVMHDISFTHRDSFTRFNTICIHCRNGTSGMIAQHNLWCWTSAIFIKHDYYNKCINKVIMKWDNNKIVDAEQCRRFELAWWHCSHAFIGCFLLSWHQLFSWAE